MPSSSKILLSASPVLLSDWWIPSLRPSPPSVRPDLPPGVLPLVEARAPCQLVHSIFVRVKRLAWGEGPIVLCFEVRLHFRGREAGKARVLCSRTSSMASDAFCAWTRTAEEVLEHWKSDVEQGLGTAEVLRRRDLFGWNELEKEEKKPLWKLILEQFEDALVRVRGQRDRKHKRTGHAPRTPRARKEAKEADSRPRCTPPNTLPSVGMNPARGWMPNT